MVSPTATAPIASATPAIRSLGWVSPSGGRGHAQGNDEQGQDQQDDSQAGAHGHGSLVGWLSFGPGYMAARRR